VRSLPVGDGLGWIIYLSSVPGDEHDPIEFHGMWTRDGRMKETFRIIEKVAAEEMPVLVRGETGTGKELVAQALHALSPRKAGPFRAINCAALPPNLLESELFGHTRGAFTGAVKDSAGHFQLADGGTLFLDEIGNIPLSQQAKMLRTIETGEFERVGSSRTYRADVRLISATNSDLPAEVAAGKFRQDLLFRLNTIQLHLPPLRERREDIEILALHFLKQHVTRYRKGITGFDESALQALRDYAWPGNVRELDHAVERGVLMAPGKVLRTPDLGLNATAATPRIEEMSIEEVEAFLIKKTLSRCDGNARKAAEELGLSRSAFYRRLEKYGL
jgi:DNA-binding NtrC family response regulator